MAKAAKVLTSKETRWLQDMLKEPEIETLTEESQKLYGELGHLEAKLAEVLRELRAKHRKETKKVTAELRAELKKVEKEFKARQHKIYTGKVHRDVECEKRIDHETGIVIVVRLDTKDVIERRPMNAEEKQLEAFQE